MAVWGSSKQGSSYIVSRGISCTWTLVVVHRLSCSVACGILVPWPGTEPVPPTLGAQSPWTSREVPGLSLLNWTLCNSQESGGREKSPFLLAARTFTSLVSLSPWAGASFWLHENHALPQLTQASLFHPNVILPNSTSCLPSEILLASSLSILKFFFPITDISCFPT